MNKEQRQKKWPWLRFTSAFVDAYIRLLALTAPVWGVTVLAIVLLGLVFSTVERIRVFNGLYYAFITAMTIGYGDITPATLVGKILSVLIGLFGILTTGVLVALALQAVKMAHDTYRRATKDDSNPAK